MDLVDQLRYLVLAAQREGSRRLSAALRPLGTTPAQAEVLTVLREVGRPLSVRELGGLLVCETGSPSRLARSTVTAGWVEPVADETDGRVTRLRLTAHGRHTADRVAQVEAGFREAFAGTLPDAAALQPVIEVLRSVVADGPSGQALARRRAGLAERGVVAGR